MSDDKITLGLEDGPPPSKQPTEASVEQYSLCAVLQRLYPPTDLDETQESWFERAVVQLYADHHGRPVLISNLYGGCSSSVVASAAKALLACRNATKRKREFARVQGTGGPHGIAPVEALTKVIDEAKPGEIACITRQESGDFIASTFATQIKVPPLSGSQSKRRRQHRKNLPRSETTSAASSAGCPPTGPSPPA